MASTLAGNFTILGSIANLIVVQKAAASRRGHQLLGLFPGRRTVDPHHAGDRHVLDVAVTPVATGRRFHPRSLDAINFLLSDVRGALGPLPECLPGHPAALEPVRSRPGDDCRRSARPVGADADRRRDRRNPRQAGRDRARARRAGGRGQRDLHRAAFLAGGDRQYAHGHCRRRVRPRGRGADPGPLCAETVGPAHGTQFGF